MNNKPNLRDAFNPQLLAATAPGTQEAYAHAQDHLVSAMTKYLSQSPSERNRERAMKDLGLTEAMLVALPREQREATQREIDRRIDMLSAPRETGWHQDIDARGTAAAHGTVKQLFANLLSLGARH